MFKKSHPLQSKSEIILRNIVVVAMVAFFIVFLIIPIGIAFAGSFHEWNPLSGTYKFLGLENYKQVFTSKLFGKSMFNTVIFSVVVIVFRVGLGLGIAYAIYSTLIKHKSFFRAVYYMPVVTPMVAGVEYNPVNAGFDKRYFRHVCHESVVSPVRRGLALRLCGSAGKGIIYESIGIYGFRPSLR